MHNATLLILVCQQQYLRFKQTDLCNVALQLIYLLLTSIVV